MGFDRGLANPCCFYHKTRDITLIVHGDDFTALGRREDLLWYEEQLAASFGVKIRGHFGEGPHCEKEMKIQGHRAQPGRPPF